MKAAVYDLSDLSDEELAYLTTEPCTCTRGYATGDSIDAYTCFAHRAEAQLDKRAAPSQQEEK